MKKALLMTLLLFSVCLVYGQSKKFKAGDKVEVKYEGEWIEATYVMNLGEKFSNMKKTPHKASFKNAFVSGASMFSDADIRAYTGTIKPLFTPQPKASTVNANELEDAIIAEINTMRANPQAYADKLALLKSKYVLASGSYWYLDIPGEGGMYIADSESARKDHERWLDETIADLRKSPVLSQLKKDERLRVSSHYLASDRGTINGPAHTDSKGRGAQDRAKLAGYTHGVNECLVGGYTSAYGFVTSFLIDWKVESRGHRKNLMEPNINDIGVACGYFPNTDGGYIRNVIQGGYRRADDSLIGSSDTDISINKPRIEKPKIEKPVIEEPVIEKPKIEKPLKPFNPSKRF